MSHDHEHDESAHGAEPIQGVDATAMHRVVDELATALHAYVETAVGVRAEFGATEADEDPRILALEATVGGLNAKLYDLLHESLGLHADLTSYVGRDGQRRVETGDVELRIGASSADIRATLPVTLAGPERIVGFDRVMHAGTTFTTEGA